MENTEKLVGQATPEQIEAWKKQHRDVYAVKVDGHIGYLRKPSRKALSYASVAGKNDALKFNEVILNECWLGGDEAIKTDDALFLSASSKIADLIEVKEAELEKL